jgi:hypothetical protein
MHREEMEEMVMHLVTEEAVEEQAVEVQLFYNHPM